MIQKPHAQSLTTGIILAALLALGPLSTSIYIPSMPAIAAGMKTDAETVTLTLTFFLAGFAVAQLVYGPLSDCFGRRPVLFAGIGLYVLSSFAAATAADIGLLIAARLGQGLGACAGQVLGRAMVRDIHGPERTAGVLAYIGLAIALIPALAPIIGGYVQVWLGWRANFFLLAGAGAAMVLVVRAWLGETNPRRAAALGTVGLGELARTYARLLGRADFLGYLSVVAFVFSGLMAFTAVSPFLFIGGMGMSPDTFGLLSLFNVAGFVLGSFAAARLSGRFGAELMVKAGLLLVLIGGGAMTGLALGGAWSIAAIIGPMMIFLAGMGIVMPNAMAGAMAPYPESTGAASALLGFFQMGGASLVSMFAGRLPRENQFPQQLPMALAIGGLGLAAFLAFAFFMRRRLNEL
jgi:DHA1 family bicyclomycin/chloramphenicol resistance-like MFS transporter